MSGELAAADEMLWNAWSRFCDELKEAGQLIFQHDGPANVQNRAAGFEYLARYLPKALDHTFNSDPMYPQLFRLQTPTSKSFGDNPDCTYLVSFLDGAETYRIVGNRGSVKWVSFLIEPGVINNSDLITNWDGSFEIVLSAQEHPGNWIPLKPRLNRLLVREFFGSWHGEEPMRLSIERVGQKGPPPPPTPEDVSRRLIDTVKWLRDDSTRWSRFVSYYRQWPNEFLQQMPDFLATDGYQGRLQRLFSFCHWQVEHDEALVITVKPPRCLWWNFEMNNEWMNTVDFRYRLSTLNSEQAVLNDDGTLVIVLSHADPGIPNWLDGGGYTSGEINQRWLESDGNPVPQARRVKFADLAQALPAGTPRIDERGRREQIRLRKAGTDRRFPA